MSLTKAQQQAAIDIYQQATKNYGLSSDRALELVGVSYMESGLDTTNYYGKSSGQPWQGEGKQAAGLFQLLSSGYITQAEAIGQRRGDQPGSAVFDPVANIQAILPTYQAYWNANPNAATGAAGAAVEASGESANWYGSGVQAYLNAANYPDSSFAKEALGQGDPTAASAKPSVLPAGVSSAVGGAVSSATHSVTGAFSSVEDAFNFIFSYRFLELLGGSALILVGVVGLMREIGVKSPTLPGPAGKLATGGT